MKKILLLIIMPFVFFPALSAQITQKEADEIVMEHISKDNTTSYTLFAKEELEVTTGTATEPAESMTIALSTGEVFELDYACWAYYVSQPNTGRFLIVKASNGNLLSVNAKADEGDLATWKMRVVGKNGDCSVDLKTGEITELKSGETACNAQYGLSLSVENINDCRCQIGTECFWEGYASVEFHLTTQKGQYDFTLDTHQPPIFKNDTIIEGIKYQLVDVSPYPVLGEEQEKIVKILVDDEDLIIKKLIQQIKEVSVETLIIGSNSFVLDAYLWRDFMPISPPNGTPMISINRLIDTNMLKIPSNISMVKQYVIYKDDVWIADYENEAPSSNLPEYKMERISRNGPKWSTNIYVDVISLIHDSQSNKNYYIERKNVRIEETH